MLSENKYFWKKNEAGDRMDGEQSFGAILAVRCSLPATERYVLRLVGHGHARGRGHDDHETEENGTGDCSCYAATRSFGYTQPAQACRIARISKGWINSSAAFP